ncbi:MAG: N-acetylglucosamine-6-phosphate deacetylase [Sphingobacterium sp.]|jgi:N-acetylglucosamine-6-phosphate deacetylase|nr:N-acetylglucosamine-6-phosphate deacetylase [Sphingobacterium sp.]
MVKKTALHNGTIYSGYDILQHHALLISDGRIAGIVPENEIPDGFEKIDVAGDNICPGLIDLQIYGAGGDLFSETPSVDALGKIEQELLRQGCTSFYLTLATNTIQVFDEAIRVFKEVSPRVTLGLHLEGPFLNAKKRGAHPEALIVKADLSTLQHLLEGNEDAVGIITVAPELLEQDCFDYLVEKGLLISAGHTDATFQEASEAFDKGIKAATHLWNAMSPLHHRRAGVPGAIFNHKEVCASIVVDGIHVDYEVVKISKAQLGERLFLITDAVTDCDSGIYQHVFNKDHYVLPDGTLSGSALTMLGAIRNCVEKVGVQLDEAIRMATTYPARLIDRADIGHLGEGAKANVLVFDPHFNVKKVYFEGEKV